MESSLLPELKQGLLYSLIYHVLLGICIVFFVWLASHTLSFSLLRERFNAWDGNSYSYLGTHGYALKGEEASYIVFYPLYPLLIWLLMYVIPQAHIAGALISFLGSLFGHAFFYVFLRSRSFTTRESLRILLLLFASPVTIYFVLVHTEGLFLLWSSLFLLSLQKQKWGWAATWAALATLTRFTGITFVIPFIFSMFVHRKMYDLKTWVVVPLTISGFLFYLGMNTFLFHSPFHYQRILAVNWHKYPVNPIAKYVSELKGLSQLPDDPATFKIDVLSTLMTPLLISLYVIFTRRKRNWSDIVFALCTWGIITSQSYWLSNTRYIGLILPLYIFMGDLTRLSKWIYLSLLTLCGLMAIGGVWIFAQGGWLY